MGGVPKKWLAVVLGLLSPVFAMLYVAQAVWAGVYLVAVVGASALGFTMVHSHPIASLVLLYGLNVVGMVHAYFLARAYPAEKPRPRYSLWYGLLSFLIAYVAVAFVVRSFLFEPFRIPSGAMIPSINPGSYVIVKKSGYGYYGTYGFLPFSRPITAELRRGDVLVFDYPEDRSIKYIKRLIAMPGDRVAYLDKKLSINGKQVAEVELEKLFDGARHERVLKLEETIDGNRFTVLRNEDAGINTSILNPVVSSFRFAESCKYSEHGVVCDVPAGHYYFMGDNRDNSRDSRYWGFVPADHIVGKVIHVVD
jgi:signal peptidase I